MTPPNPFLYLFNLVDSHPTYAVFLLTLGAIAIALVFAALVGAALYAAGWFYDLLPRRWPVPVRVLLSLPVTPLALAAMLQILYWTVS